MTTARLTTVIFLMLTTFAFGQTAKYTCVIKTDSYVYKKGNAPKISVEIKNNSDSTIELVKSLDGSCFRQRFPYAYFKIEKLGYKSYVVDSYAYCGNYDDIDTTDFAEVKPGETFDPYKYQTPVYSDYGIKNPKNFQKKGKYKVTYYYSTKEPHLIKWMGDPYTGQALKWFDWKTKKVKPENEAEYNRLITLFHLVPQMELISNELIIEIK